MATKSMIDAITDGSSQASKNGVKNAYKLLNLLNFHLRMKYTSFNVWVRYIVYLWNSMKDAIFIKHWNFKSS